MAETLKTFVGARLAVDKDRKEPSDLTAEDDALVSLLAGAGVSDPKGRGHFAEALRDHLLASQPRAAAATISTASDEAAVETDLGATGDGTLTSDPFLQQEGEIVEAESTEQSPLPGSGQHSGHTHGIASHGHRAFLIDESNPAAGSADTKHDASKQKT